MSKLSNKVRLECHSAIMYEAFAPRFAELKSDAASFLRAFRVMHHPEYEKLRTNPEAAKYLMSIGNPLMCARNHVNRHLYIPAYYTPPEHGFPSRCYMGLDAGYRKLTDDDGLYPQAMSVIELDEGDPFVKHHDALWTDFIAAHEKVGGLLASYVSREKFEADFPELASKLPARPTKVMLPAVNVKKVRADLEKFGIPPGDA